MLKVDNREPIKIFRILNRQKIEHEKCQLPVGDFVLEEKSLCVERKSIQDFYQSICGSHMWDQCINMSENFQNNYIIISGDVKGIIFTIPHFSLSIYLGAVASLSAKYGMKVLKVDNDNQLITLVSKLCAKTGETPTHTITRHKISSETVKLSMVACIPGISTKKARLLLDYFNQDLEKLFHAPLEELKQVEGIGDKIANNILEVFRNESKDTDGIQSDDSRDSTADCEVHQVTHKPRSF